MTPLTTVGLLIFTETLSKADVKSIMYSAIRVGDDIARGIRIVNNQQLRP
jgi:hypothetical protein